MHFSDVEVGKRLFVGNGQPIALKTGEDEVRGSAFIEGPLQTGDAAAFGSIVATQMIARDTNEESDDPPRSLWVKGNTRLEGDAGTPWAVNLTGNQEILGNGQTEHGLYVSGGGGDNTVYIEGDLYVSGATDTGNKGRLATRFGTADSLGKVFDMVHPTKGQGHRLAHACIEGPEVAVYFRGRLKHKEEIDLPSYWKGLVHIDSITVHLQPIGAHQDIIIKRWDDEKIYLQSKPGFPIDCFYYVCGERKDINPLHVEYEGETWEDYPDPNHRNFDPLDPNRNLLDETYRGSRNVVTM